MPSQEAIDARREAIDAAKAAERADRVMTDGPPRPQQESKARATDALAHFRPPNMVDPRLLPALVLVTAVAVQKLLTVASLPATSRELEALNVALEPYLLPTPPQG